MRHYESGGMTMNEEHITTLHERVHGVSKLHMSVGETDDFEEFLRLIHQPGWTTPVELILIHALVDSAERAAVQAVQARQSLIEGARAIANASVGV